MLVFKQTLDKFLGIHEYSEDAIKGTVEITLDEYCSIDPGTLARIMDAVGPCDCTIRATSEHAWNEACADINNHLEITLEEVVFPNVAVILKDPNWPNKRQRQMAYLLIHFMDIVSIDLVNSTISRPVVFDGHKPTVEWCVGDMRFQTTEIKENCLWTRCKKVGDDETQWNERLFENEVFYQLFLEVLDEASAPGSESAA